MQTTPSLKLVFLDRETLAPQTTLKDFPFPHTLEIFDRTPAAAVASRIRDADIVLTNKVAIPARAIADASKLKLIAVAATGTDPIDLAACRARGVTVTHIRNYASTTVPEHTFALILALRRSLTAYLDAVRAGRWQQADQFCFFDFPIRDLRGSTLGIIGDGVLGHAVADMARALGLRVLFSAHRGHAPASPLHTPFESVLEHSDIVSLHCPLTPETRNLIGRAEFAAMKRRPLLINTARGGLVDELALVEALESGLVSGAGFDVATEEPMPATHPFQRILSHPAFILTPHVAWASNEAMQSLADQLVDNVSAFVRGQPVNLVSLPPPQR